MSREYRIRWRREGLAPRRELRQTEWGAESLVQRLVGLELADIEEPMDEQDPFGAPVPMLVEGPTVESRPVGIWS